MGLIVSFMYGIYPTSLSFNPLTAADPYNIAYYTMSAGCAAFTGAIVFRRLIKRLEKNGLAYRAENGDVYFDTQAWRANYGRLIGQDVVRGYDTRALNERLIPLGYRVY